VFAQQINLNIETFFAVAAGYLKLLIQMHTCYTVKLIIVCKLSVCVCPALVKTDVLTYIYTHIHTYIYIYMCVCVCVCESDIS
jgi:hypothetical protein